MVVQRLKGTYSIYLRIEPCLVIKEWGSCIIKLLLLLLLRKGIQTVDNIFFINFVCYSFRRIGYSIAKQLANDGAKVMLSSRKQENVEKALATLQRDESIVVDGVACHVGKEKDRQNLIKQVCVLYSTFKTSEEITINYH